MMSLRLLSPRKLLPWKKAIQQRNFSQIGFIGLGNMGGHMASNLIRSGHKLNVYDISKKACSNLKALGATVYSRTPDLAKNSEIVITMLPNNSIVNASYEEMLSEGINKGTIFIDSSTISPELVKSLQNRISLTEGRFLDAPVSGGVPGAEQATLTFMVGGAEKDFKAVKDILQCMGKRIIYCGIHGMGQAAKLCNNMMLAISMIGVSETMNLAVRQGLDPKIFAEILNSSTGRCWTSEFYNPVPGITASTQANKVPIELINKDLELVANLANSSSSPIPMGLLTHNIYSSLIAQGLGRRDFSDVYALMETEKFHYKQMFLPHQMLK
ncbi:probable 3-hydroxyisobutyrate dehydrogenase, mitochondrial isoform X2 [Drosophila gunungcola]|nr:probable 3-hydroxyisobutyrate dehydrogenase, mitochondrial isoform X2 [Drosophila gunungcola]XP_052841410.1 probable 3-hydroxyisobutyrate dehydrogenase, mitochondrial isoform X2 [Drosophila gunungcola]